MIFLREVKTLCRRYSVRPLRRRGQNFLINTWVIKKILKAADLKEQDIILEIGAGLGTLTKEISKKVKKVIAVEIDKKLIEVLENELAGYKNIEIVQGDIRNLKVEDFKLKNYKIVANLPFNITGLVLKQFLACSIKPEIMVLILQKEVGQRIIAQPPQMSKLSVMVQFYSQAKITAQIKKDNFWPRPKIDSVILRIIPHRDPTTPKGQTPSDKFFQVVQAGFSSPRKYLLNNLVKSGIMGTVPKWGLSLKETVRQIFKQTGLNEKIRAQELSVEDWIKLVKTLEYDNKK